MAPRLTGKGSFDAGRSWLQHIQKLGKLNLTVLRNGRPKLAKNRHAEHGHTSLWPIAAADIVI